MKSKKKVAVATSRNARRRIEHEAEAGASGALVGAVVGASAGPPGALAGAIIGGVAGALAGAVMDQESSAREQRTRELDAEIGVSGGDLGAPNLEHPAPKRGTYSAAASGVSPADDAPAEGPIQVPQS
jgi:outer membrane lipoprotein SlyB